MLGYLYAVVGMICFGMLGILSKLSDRRQCTPSATCRVLFGASTVMMALYVLVAQGGGFAPPRRIIGIAVVFGILAVTSSWVFLLGIRFGKISTSWVFINLSAAVPVVASTFFYGEKVGFRKLVTLGLVFVAILFLWKDMRDEKKTLRTSEAANSGNPAGEEER
jgi:drug/metabolite transporter (DMT)-like permease